MATPSVYTVAIAVALSVLVGTGRSLSSPPGIDRHDGKAWRRSRDLGRCQSPEPPGPADGRCSRRAFVAVAATTPGLCCNGLPVGPVAAAAQAERSDDPVDTAALGGRIFVRGVVTLPPDVAQPTLNEGTEPALYVTCRPNRPDNVPSAILSGTRGKPPPVLAAKFVEPSFPFRFNLTGNDLTAEGVSRDGLNRETDPRKFWWNNDSLVVSARWDNDGIAATRSPDDLVGRGSYDPNDVDRLAQVQLTGRGAFGKFATGGVGKKN